MKKTIHICYIIVFIGMNSSSAQFVDRLQVYAGPSITNFLSYWQGSPRFFINPEREFYKISYHFGVDYRIAFSKNIEGRIGLFYEGRGTSHDGFNQATSYYEEFIGVPISLLVQPNKKYPFLLEYGLFWDYMFYNPLIFDAGSIIASNKYGEIGLILGLEYRVFKNFSIRSRWLHPFNYLNHYEWNYYDDRTKKDFIFKTKTKSQSFQVSLIYQMTPND